jgi:hypothetical protein
MSTAASVAKLMGFREERIDDLKTAVAEACINAIEHGNRLNEKLSVGVTLSAGTDQLEIKVMDDGKGMKSLPIKPDIDARCMARKIPAGWACSSSRRWSTRQNGSSAPTAKAATYAWSSGWIKKKRNLPSLTGRSFPVAGSASTIL